MKRNTERGDWFGRRLRSAASIFLFFACAAFAGVGATVAFLDPTRPRAVGATAMIVATAIAAATVRRWRSVLPAIFACGALNALMIASEGHALNSPGVPVSRPIGIVLTLAMAAAATLTTLVNRSRFTPVERLCFVGIFLCFAALFSSFDIQVVATAGALCFSALPLLIALLSNHRKKSII